MSITSARVADELSDVLTAISHPSRREILGRLAKGPARFTDVAEPFDLSLNMITKHLKLLERAGLALFVVAGGAGFQEYTDDNVCDPRVVALARSIRTEVDAEIEAQWQKTRPRGARVTVRLHSGAEYTEIGRAHV